MLNANDAVYELLKTIHYFERPTIYKAPFCKIGYTVFRKQG